MSTYDKASLTLSKELKCVNQYDNCKLTLAKQQNINKNTKFSEIENRKNSQMDFSRTHNVTLLTFCL